VHTLASMNDDASELAVVIYSKEHDGAWHPTQVFTRRWMRFADDSEGWTYTLYDGSWCQRDEQLHLHHAGGGPPYVEGPSVEPGIHWRIWLAPSESVCRNTAERPDGTTIADRRAPGLSDAELLAIGYELVSEHPGDVFDGASDDATAWCEKCEDWIPRYVNQCEHHVTCWACGDTYASEGDEEDRCPECQTSQCECDHCGEQGAETCISCGQWICNECWSGHDDDTPHGKCERGKRNWREPTKRGKRRPPKPIDRIHARLKAAIEVSETVGFWGQAHTIHPRLCSKVFGDGRALLALYALNSRPNYYAIRIDSSWKVEDYRAPDDAPDLRDHLDDIYQALEDDFGSVAWADDEDVIADGRSGDYLDWPTFDGDSGTSWGRMAWPEWKDVMRIGHPFARYDILVPASPVRAIQREAKRRRAGRRKRRGW
jgi:hypothetical protein